MSSVAEPGGLARGSDGAGFAGDVGSLKWHAGGHNSSGARRRAHLEVATEEARPLTHAEQAEVRCRKVVEHFGRKAAPVVGHGKTQLVGAEPDAHLQPPGPSVAERVAHRLLGDAESTKFDVGGEAN